EHELIEAEVRWLQERRERVEFVQAALETAYLSIIAEPEIEVVDELPNRAELSLLAHETNSAVETVSGLLADWAADHEGPLAPSEHASRALAVLCDLHREHYQ